MYILTVDVKQDYIRPVILVCFLRKGLESGLDTISETRADDNIFVVAV